ncbi:MAG: hypothetical protein EBT07_09340, partial [Actinobacteria bacterium]|nr:hypothetical protein [Actinomycetota bacterium]
AMLLTAESGSNNDEYHYLWIDSDNIYGLIGIVGANPHIFRTTAVLRDPSAWFHMVSIFDTDNSVGADRWQIWINGVKQSLTVTSTMSQGFASGWVNNNNKHYVGRRDNYSLGYNSDFQLTEINFVDGQALEPSNFGETDPQTGVWIPFANNSSTTALGYDSSGNGNNWTPNNFSVTPGSDNDSLVDVPSLYGVDTGLGGEVRGNYCTWNPLVPADGTTFITYSDGNLIAASGTGATQGQSAFGSLSISNGKWYYEATFTQSGSTSFDGSIGFAKVDSGGLYTSNNNYAYIYLRNGQKGLFGTQSNYATSFGSGDIIGIALDLDAGTITFYKNGVNLGIAFTGISGTLTPIARLIREASYSSQFAVNFGQRPWAYQAPSGFKALCTTNLSAPAIGQTSDNQADNYFQAVTYTGNGSARSITGVGFQPDMVWAKARSVAYNNVINDAIRGAGKTLQTDLTAAEVNEGSSGLTSFTIDGFNIGGGSGGWNANGVTYVAWCWNAGGTTVTNTSGTISSQVRANSRSGFSIVTYTGNGTVGATVGHSLGATPGMVIVKSRSSSQNWAVKILPYMTGGQRLQLNTTDAILSESAGTGSLWNAVNPNSTVITLGDQVMTNTNGTTYIAYCWAPIAGYSAFGSFTHNASADGAFVYTGFRPKFVMMKGIGTSNWMILDTTRDTNNFMGRELLANLTNTESSPNVTYSSDFLSNGFKLRNQGLNDTFIYIAFAETPTRLATAR